MSDRQPVDCRFLPALLFALLGSMVLWIVVCTEFKYFGPFAKVESERRR